MRNDILVFLFVFVVLSSTKAQSLIGAWETQIDANIEGNKTTVTLFFLFSKRHHVAAAYHTKTGAYMATFGGSYSLQDTTLTQTIEFDSENSDRIGKTKSYSIEFNDEELLIKGDDLKLKRIDKGTPGDLAGAWLISSRMRDGALQKRDTNRPRKTMKVLSGTRFQWIAYNTETKEFMGTGGGTYTTVDGKYTENIQFFSRDDSRVGTSLQFNYELKEGYWHHSRLSSKGKPIYEVWSVRTQ